MVLADKWVFYKTEVQRLRAADQSETHVSKSIYMDGKSVPKTAELMVLKALGLNRYCCRKHMLTHVDLIDKI
jgi:DNA-directed RNA polymerase I, II, and III subunit RPABC5